MWVFAIVWSHSAVSPIQILSIVRNSFPWDCILSILPALVSLPDLA